MRLSGIIDESIVDGPGIRMTIFFQGCTHNCYKCHNPETHSFTGGKEYDLEYVDKKLADSPYLDGVTFSGGDPLDNPESALEIAELVKEKYNLNLWIYTGYTFEEILEKSKNNKIYLDIFSLTDVLVDGPFVNNLRDLSLLYRGSTNQRIIDVKQSLKNNSIVTLNY